MTYPNRLLRTALLAGALAACDDGTSPEGTASAVAVRVYVDADGSASFTAADVPISGATVTLSPNTGGEMLQATTDAEGMARFSGVEPGSYTVEIAEGAAAGTVFSSGSTLVVRAPFEGAELEREFRLEYLPSRVAGVVYRDDDGTGAPSPADRPGAGFVVNLYAGGSVTGTPRTTTTDAEGRYAFELLPPGSYTVEVVPPVATVSFPGGAARTVTLTANEVESLDLPFVGVLLVTIADALAESLGTSVVVEGVVTAAQGTFGSRSIYMQDPTGGVQVFGVDSGAGLELGDSLRVSGTLSAFNGQLQIGSPTVDVLGTGTVPAPVTLTGAQVNARTHEGQLARVENVTVTAVGGSATSTAYNVTVTDPAGISFVVRVSGSGVGIPQTYWEIGSKYDVVGLLGSFRGTAQLLPRAPSDVTAAGAATPIQEAKSLAAGTEVTIAGVVTAGTNQLFNAFYVQDATSGIMVFVGSNPATPVQPGDSVTVTGEVGAFNGEAQISGDPTVTVLKQAPVPAPVTLTGAEVNARSHEGELARVNDVTVTSVGGSASSTSYNVTVRDGAGESFTVRVSGSSVGIPQTYWQVGSTYDVIGVLGSFRGTAQLKPRSQADVSAK